MNASFNPYHMRPLATLNSRAVAALPGVDPRIAGQTGSQLLSKRALSGLVAARAGELGLEGADPAQYPRLLNELLSASEAAEGTRRIAESIAGEYGYRLGCLVASMVLAPTHRTDPLDPWEAAYLDYWRAEAREITLGGGHATGRLGILIAQAVEEALAGCGLGNWRARAAEHASFLPLIGAARSLPVENENGRAIEKAGAVDPGGAGEPLAAVVADFGGTRGKCGVARYDARGRLAGLRVLPPRDVSALAAAWNVPGLAAAMVEVMAAGLAAAAGQGRVASRLLCSVGAYVENDLPVNTDRGTYTALHRLGADLRGWFAEQIGREYRRLAGRELFQRSEVIFGHDCDLAARALAGRPRSAVIMLGSAIGVGFVPPGEGFREIAEGFEVVQEG